MIADRSIPEDGRALVAIDLGAESCRVSLLRDQRRSGDSADTLHS
jgi:hypothetical protein